MARVSAVDDQASDTDFDGDRVPNDEDACPFVQDLNKRMQMATDKVTSAMSTTTTTVELTPRTVA